LVGLEGGSAGKLPTSFADNATVLTYQGDSSTSINLTVQASTNLSDITFFVADNLMLALSGNFWQSGVSQTVTAVDGSQRKTVLPPTAWLHACLAARASTQCSKQVTPCHSRRTTEVKSTGLAQILQVDPAV
jgi:hypothetical protein